MDKRFKDFKIKVIKAKIKAQKDFISMSEIDKKELITLSIRFQKKAQSSV